MEVTNNISDEVLLWQQFRDGSETAHNQLMQIFIKPMFDYGYRIVPDRDFVKDCIQDVFFELWNRRERISTTTAVKAYLFKSVRLRIYREQNKWGKHQSFEDDSSFSVDFDIETQIIQNQDVIEKKHQIHSVLSQLPPRQKEIIYLRFYENLDFEKISQIMQINRQSVYNLLQKSFNNFRAVWSAAAKLLF